MRRKESPGLLLDGFVSLLGLLIFYLWKGKDASLVELSTLLVFGTFCGLTSRFARCLIRERSKDIEDAACRVYLALQSKTFFSPGGVAKLVRPLDVLNWARMDHDQFLEGFTRPELVRAMVKDFGPGNARQAESSADTTLELLLNAGAIRRRDRCPNDLYRLTPRGRRLVVVDKREQKRRRSGPSPNRTSLR